jgi:hypothetical protein
VTNGILEVFVGTSGGRRSRNVVILKRIDRIARLTFSFTIFN